jgi:membrane protease subunit (stomatin/prohibitin family)
MGLIRAALAGAASTLADQWKEYFYCEAIPSDTLAVRGHRTTTAASSNHGDDNIISSGSAITVADGQCMLIVDNGAIAEVCAEPGQFIYDASTEPSVFAGSFGEGLRKAFEEFRKRFTFGGQKASDQRIYYINTKEIPRIRYGTPSPVPFRVVDRNANLDIDIGVRCFGEYSLRISNPILFYKNVAGNFPDSYRVSQIEEQLRSELLTALQPAFARISEEGVRYSAVPGHAAELADLLNKELSSKWRDLRGIEIASFGMSSISASDEDAQMIKNMQKTAALRDQSMAAATMVDASAEAMKGAANNANGAMAGFLGFGMAQNAANGAGLNIGQMYQAGASKKPGGWTCPSCGTVNDGNFCTQCGTKKPEEGKTAEIRFCPNCGHPFDDPSHPPKFCPNCGRKIE